MALTVCRHCGRTVSDTVETCIHCGGILAEPVVEPEILQPQDAQPQAEAEEQVVYDYFLYSEEQRKNLELAFLESDAWAYKYRHTGIELEKFKSLFGDIMAGLFIPAAALLLAFCFIFDMEAYSVDLIKTALMGGGILFAVSLPTMLVLSIVIKVREKSEDKLIYIKKYQKWLLEEKSISYGPKFAKTQMQELFDSINIDKLTF